ncbi:Spy/CpxP family protein refolding chaperone [Bradyrhizobium sp.]|uniref:Spy/CpxP family protein refolding chaperone n=1 Tax=Bradyrhizobium sp. TaxID=376 RepID=UPI00403809DD
MSISRIGMAALGMAVLVLSSAAEARRFRIGGPLGVARFAVTRMLSLGGLARVHRPRDSAHVRSAGLKPPEIRAAIASGDLLGNSAARGQIVAAAALAGWHGGRGAKAWWQHGDGGYGWVGPLYWPFAYHDMQDYMILGEPNSFWAYGYGDIYAGIFAPYRDDALARYMGSDSSSRKHRRIATVAQFCGDDSPEAVDPAIDRIREAVQPTETQRAALDNLAIAWRSAALVVRATCPRQAATTPLERLAAMKERLEAMLKAAQALQHPLEDFYYLLDDEQQARLNALAEERQKPSATDQTGATKVCQPAPTTALKWPAEEIEARVQLNDTQRAALEVLQDTSASAADTLNGECRPEAVTSISRLAAVNRRLQSLLQSVSQVNDALDDFLATLSDEQKAQFDAIGQLRNFPSIAKGGA